MHKTCLAVELSTFSWDPAEAPCGTSYDHRVTKTYFFMYTISDIYAVISCKTKELRHFHL